MNKLTRTLSVLTIALMLTACATPTPEADLDAAVAAIDIVSVLPGLSPLARTWLSDAAGGASCSASVLGKGETAAQEAVDIGACFASLPEIPASDQAFIGAAFSLVKVFLDLFGAPVAVPVVSAAQAHQIAAPTPGRIAIKANAEVHKMSPKERTKLLTYLSATSARAQAVRDRLK